MKKSGFFIACLVCLISVSQAKDGELKTSPLAISFGSQPDFRSMSLSPDGNKLAIIQYHPDGFDFVRILDLMTLKISSVILSTPKDEGHTEISWCTWVNDERLLCGLKTRYSFNDTYTYAGRMLGLNYDGIHALALPGSMIDRLPDDPNHVLIQFGVVRSSTADTGDTLIWQWRRNSRVGVLDIYTGKISNKTYPQSAFLWFSDGHGVPRLYRSINDDYQRWYVRKPKGKKVFWDVLHEVKANNFIDSFVPVGFADNPEELLYLDLNEGRTALFSMDLAHDRETRLVFAHDRVDVMGVKTLGKYNRTVAATYIDDKSRYYFFDKDIQRVHELITQLFPDKNVSILEEDWNRRYYIVAISSDVEPGVYYRYDSQEFKLKRIASISSKLKDRKLAPMKEIAYPARDQVSIPAFLTLPDGDTKTGLPAVVLPHGGPSSRDIWDYDPLVQFLTANGFAVLQSNYRGSTGYGEAWFGNGAFRNWERVVSDVNDGAQYLIDQGIADPGKICVGGWSFGGYAALMSAIDSPSLYRCIISIAGVTDPREFGLNRLKYVGGETVREFIGADEVGDSGSPLKRAGEIQVPVLLAHAQEDANVPFSQSMLMHEALMKNNKSVEFFEYEHAEHAIKPEKYRVDLFTRLAEFLEQHTK